MCNRSIAAEEEQKLYLQRRHDVPPPHKEIATIITQATEEIDLENCSINGKLCRKKSASFIQHGSQNFGGSYCSCDERGTACLFESRKRTSIKDIPVTSSFSAESIQYINNPNEHLDTTHSFPLKSKSGLDKKTLTILVPDTPSEEPSTPSRIGSTIPIDRLGQTYMHQESQDVENQEDDLAQEVVPTKNVPGNIVITTKSM